MFCYSCDTQIADYLEVIEGLEEEHNAITADYAETEKSTEQKKKELDLIMEECRELESQIAHENKLQSAAREEANSLKRQANDLKDELATAEWTLQEMEAEEEQLRTQVVSSPDRRKKEVTTARDHLDSLKAQVAEVEDATQRGKKSSRNIQQALQDVTAIVGNLDDLQQTCDRHVDTGRQLEKARQEITVQKNRHQTLLEQTQQAERDVGREDGKIEAQRKQHEIQIKALQEALDVAKTQLLQVEKERRDGMIHIQKWEQEVKRLEQEVEQQQLATQDETDGMVAEYKLLEEEFLQQDFQRMAKLQSSSLVP